MFLVMYFAFLGLPLFGCMFLGFRYIKIKTLQIDFNDQNSIMKMFRTILFFFLDVNVFCISV